METNTRRVWYRNIIYPRCKKNTVADKLSILTLNGNEETTHKSTYQQEIVSEINDIDKIPECNFPINLKLIQKYQRAEPSITDKYKYVLWR